MRNVEGQRKLRDADKDADDNNVCIALRARSLYISREIDWRVIVIALFAQLLSRLIVPTPNPISTAVVTHNWDFRLYMHIV